MHDITGALAITGLGTIAAGVVKCLKFEGAATLTHNATSLILPGAANIVCADGDVGIFISEGSGNWRCLGFMRANGSHLGPVLATEQASTSGTEIDFTGIPPWAKKITIQFFGVSTSGTSNLMVQLGDGAVETSGYLGAATTLTNGAAIQTANFTTGIGVTTATAATSVIHGSMVLTLEDASAFTWVGRSTVGHSDAASTSIGAGSKSLSSALDRVRITTVGGTDTFDLGAINVMYE
jgi:hypothetical protein